MEYFDMIKKYRSFYYFLTLDVKIREPRILFEVIEVYGKFAASLRNMY